MRSGVMGEQRPAVAGAGRSGAPPAVASYAGRAAWIAFALTAPLYLATMNRAIGFIDRGELAAVAYTFGIPHATGYPTLMLIGGALAHLVPLRPVLVLNAFAAVLVAAGAAVLTLLLDRVLATVAPTVGATAGARARGGYALGAASFTALSVTWWQQANGFEVYALHAVLMPLVVLLCLRWVDAPAAAATRAGWAFALVLGLAFTNHLTTVLLAPGLLAVAVSRFGFGRRFWRRVASLVPPFLIGLLPYAWLPLRSAMSPRFDWGGTRTLAGFVHQVTGADYRGWMFADPASFATQARYLLWRVPWDFVWLGLLVAALGALWLARRAPALAGMAALFTLCGAVFAAGYRILDLDAYLLTTILGLATFFAAGLLRLHERLGARVAIICTVVLVALAAALHWSGADESGNRLVEHRVADVLGPLPPRAMLITTS